MFSGFSRLLSPTLSSMKGNGGEGVLARSARDAPRAVALVVAHSRGTRDRLLTHLGEERRRLRGRGFSIVESAPFA